MNKTNEQKNEETNKKTNKDRPFDQKMFHRKTSSNKKVDASIFFFNSLNIVPLKIFNVPSNIRLISEMLGDCK